MRSPFIPRILVTSAALLRVLVVEDDALNCAVVKKLLEISGVVKIETAADGSEVWRPVFFLGGGVCVATAVAMVEAIRDDVCDRLT